MITLVIPLRSLLLRNGFNDKDIKQYIKYIRKIVGSEIDLTISRQGYPTKSNFGAGVECNPAIGGNVIRTAKADCTIGFKATYQGKRGFVTAGHCMEGTGKKVGQPRIFDKLGVSIFNSDSANDTFTNCDCAFVEITEEDRDIESKVFSGSDFGLPNIVKVVGRAPSGVGTLVRQYGAFSGEGCGEVFADPYLVQFEDGTYVSGLLATDITNTVVGDSGGPVLNSNGKRLIGIITGLHEKSTNNTDATYYTRESRYRYKLGSTFDWIFSSN